MFCSNCGKELHGEKFCPNCGKQVKNSTEKTVASLNKLTDLSFDKNKIPIIGFSVLFLFLLLFVCIEISILHNEIYLKFIEIPFFIFRFGELKDYISVDGPFNFFAVLIWLSATIAEICMVVFSARGIITAVSEKTAYYARPYFKKASVSAIVFSAIVLVGVLILQGLFDIEANETLGSLSNFGRFVMKISVLAPNYFLLIFGIIGVIVENKLSDTPLQNNEKILEEVKENDLRDQMITMTNKIAIWLSDETNAENAWLDISCFSCHQKLTYEKKLIFQNSKLICPSCNTVLYDKSVAPKYLLKTIVCPKCGCEQPADRKTCWCCSLRFDTKKE